MPSWTHSASPHRYAPSGTGACPLPTHPLPTAPGYNPLRIKFSSHHRSISYPRSSSALISPCLSARIVLTSLRRRLFSACRYTPLSHSPESGSSLLSGSGHPCFHWLRPFFACRRIPSSHPSGAGFSLPPACGMPAFPGRRLFSAYRPILYSYSSTALFLASRYASTFSRSTAKTSSYPRLAASSCSCPRSA